MLSSVRDTSLQWLMERIRQRERDDQLDAIRYLHSEFRDLVEREVIDGKA